MQQILKGKYINFGVFSIFGDNSFVEFMNYSLELKFILFDQIKVRFLSKLYPKLVDLYLDNLVMVCEDSQEILFTQLPHDKISKLMLISFDSLKYI